MPDLSASFTIAPAVSNICRISGFGLLFALRISDVWSSLLLARTFAPAASSAFTTCAFALGYAPEIFAELIRVTRPGGTILVSDVHPEALKRGWTRSFRHHGEVIQVADYPYEIRDLCSPEIELSRLMEPCLGPPEWEIFERAGQLHRFEEACRAPAIFVGRWFRK